MDAQALLEQLTSKLRAAETHLSKILRYEKMLGGCDNHVSFVNGEIYGLKSAIEAMTSKKGSESQYYVRAKGQSFGDGTAYVKKSGNSFCCVSVDGAVSEFIDWCRTCQEYVDTRGWVSITEEEAQKLVKPKVVPLTTKSDEPRYYINLTGFLAGTVYVERVGDVAYCVSSRGVKTKSKWSADQDKYVTDGTWVEISKEAAEKLITKPVDISKIIKNLRKDHSNLGDCTSLLVSADLLESMKNNLNDQMSHLGIIVEKDDTLFFRGVPIVYCDRLCGFKYAFVR